MRLFAAPQTQVGLKAHLLLHCSVLCKALWMCKTLWMFEFTSQLAIMDKLSITITSIMAYTDSMAMRLYQTSLAQHGMTIPGAARGAL